MTRCRGFDNSADDGDDDILTVVNDMVVIGNDQVKEMELKRSWSSNLIDAESGGSRILEGNELQSTLFRWLSTGSIREPTTNTRSPVSGAARAAQTRLRSSKTTTVTRSQTALLKGGVV